MITIDGSMGEGGGQVLRTSLALATVTGRAFRMENIRAGRRKPGLLRQHLTAVRAAAEISQAELRGDALQSMELVFEPGPVRPGTYHFSVGTAGSATLVFQTVLPALALAAGPSELVLEGGTHNPWAPPYDFLEKVLLPVLSRMGPRVRTQLDRPGFYPAGGGRFRAWIEPVAKLGPLELLDRGPVVRCGATALVSNLPAHIAERELRVVHRKLGWPTDGLRVEPVKDPAGPGNALLLEIESANVTELVTGFGQRGVRAETVASRAVRDARRYLDAEAPVGEHLADQLLVPLALAGGRFRTLKPTPHTTTNVGVIRHFIDVQITATELAADVWEITARP